MKTIPHIDVSEDQRIEQILQDPTNAVVEAVTCETLGGWVPDIGLTTYSHRSIYRPPVLARSGLSTTLSHRFWRTYEGLLDHTGTRWIGVLIYDQQDEQCPMELEVAGRRIGRLEPTRHDNRRHLIVTEQPVDFFGGMEVFQLTAPGPGTYRIEALVFLGSCPSPTSFLPKIQHLTVRTRDAGTELHFITDHVARTHVVTRSGEKVICQSRSDQMTKLHALTLKLPSHGHYQCDVTTTGNTGEVDQASIDISLGDNPDASTLPSNVSQDVTIPVEFVDAWGSARVAPSMPVTFGVPVVQGKLPRTLTGHLQVGNTRATVQCRTHSLWPDGSARWVLVDSILPDNFPQENLVNSMLHLMPSTAPTETSPTATNLMLQGNFLRLAFDPKCPSFPATISKKTTFGDWRELVTNRESHDSTDSHTQSSSTIEVRLGNGTVLVPHPSDPICEELGTVRTVVRYHIDHCDKDGTLHIRSIIRIHQYHSQKYIRIQHRMEVVSPLLGPAAGTPNQSPVAMGPDRVSTAMPASETERQGLKATRSDVAACVGVGPNEKDTLLELSSVVAHIAIPDVSGLIRDGDHHKKIFADNHWRLVQEDDQGYRIETTGDSSPAMEVEGKYSGQILLKSKEGLVGLAVRRFWQTYPKGIEVTAAGAVVELLPTLNPLPTTIQALGEEQTQPSTSDSDPSSQQPAGALPVHPILDIQDPKESESWHQLFFWRTDRGYLLKAGQALTSEFSLSLPDSQEEAEKIASWCEQPILVRPSLDWLNSSTALSPIQSSSNSPLPTYEKAVDHACDQWLQERENFRQYGFLNFGDWYGESGWSWGNNEYDPAFAHYQEFLRGGRPEWAILAAEATRHLTDVDTCNFSSDPAQVGGQYGHMPGHAGGYLPPYFRSKVASSCMFYSHSWVEGPILHYLLTGDESVRETLDHIGEWMLNGRTHGVIGGSTVTDRQGLDAYDYGQLRDAGWHLIHLCALARWSEDPRYMNAAHLVAKRILERRTPDSGWERLLGEGHCFAGPPRTRGEASFMVGVCLSALRRYHEITNDETVATAIVDGARWLVEKTYDRKARHFRYTSSPNRGDVGPTHTQQVIDGLVYALSIKPDTDLAEIVRHGLRTLGNKRDAAQPATLGTPGSSIARGVGCSLCHETRYVPTMLAYLVRTSNSAPG